MSNYLANNPATQEQLNEWIDYFHINGFLVTHHFHFSPRAKEQKMLRSQNFISPHQLFMINLKVKNIKTYKI